MWIDELQKNKMGSIGNYDKVSCTQCKTRYNIVYPKMNRLLIILDKIDILMYNLCPGVAVIFLVGAIYWCAVTHGGITVIQIFGYKKGKMMMEKVHPALLFIGLPIIPTTVVLTKFIRWVDIMCDLIRIIFRLEDVDRSQQQQQRQRQEQPQNSNKISAIKAFCDALLWPTFATFTGKFLFNYFKSDLTKTILGGATFNILKRSLKYYHARQMLLDNGTVKF